jgi:hypothetical protein
MQLESGMRNLGGGVMRKPNPRPNIVIKAAEVAGLEPDEALRLAGIDPRRAARALNDDQDYRRSETVAQREVTQRYARLNEDQRRALLALIDSMLPPSLGDEEDPVVPPMGEPRGGETNRTTPRQGR